MPPFDPTQYQTRPNGNLQTDFIGRLSQYKERTGLSYAALGEALGFSGTFLYNMMNKEANVGTQHVERIVTSFEDLENPDTPTKSASAVSHLTHSFHLRPDIKTEIQLPADLTVREAQRLAQFVQSLPVE